jgi:hypothetical protein
MVFSHSAEFFLGYRSVLTSVKHLKNVLFWLKPFIYSLLLLRDWLLLFCGIFGGFLVLGVRSALLHQDLLHLLPVVPDSMVQKSLTSSIGNFQVDSKRNEPLKNREFVALDGIIHGRLLIIVHVIMIRAVSLEQLAAIEMS